jgi:hypothetical protein
VSSIEEEAFYGCDSLVSVIFQNGVMSIGEQAFYKCYGITNITIPGSVTYIGEEAFAGARLTSITIPGSVTFIGRSAFAGPKLSSIDVAKENLAYSSVEGVLFNKAKDTLINYPVAKQGSAYTIPNSVRTIEEGAIMSCVGLKSITLPDNLTSIGKNAFKGSRFEHITIPNSVREIGDYAFAIGLNLTQVALPNGITNIRYGTFYECRKLKSVTIPQTVASIGERAFWGCPLASVTSLNPVPPVFESEYEHAFSANAEVDGSPPANAILYVPASSVGAYKRAPLWKDFKKIRPVPK